MQGSWGTLALLGAGAGLACQPAASPNPRVERAPVVAASPDPGGEEEPEGRRIPSLDSAKLAESNPDLDRRSVCALVDPPPGMVDLGALIPSAVLVVGYHRADNFTGAALPGYEVPGIWLDVRAAEALVSVAARLAARGGWRLIFYDGYRPRRASVAMVEWAERADRLDLLRDGWVAARSLHNRGLAIDLGLADGDGVPLDMGSGWDAFESASALRGVDGEPLRLRLSLRAAMMVEGFQPYRREWWHFSYPTPTLAPSWDRAYAGIPGCE